MKFHIITLFPEMFEGVFDHSIISRAQKESLVEINLIQLRDFAVDKHGTVDDKPYGGGVGMLLMPKPIFEAVRSIKRSKNSKVVVLTPRGKRFTQEKAKELLKLDDVILICGRYEGVDERVHQFLADEELSIGDYVLSGGEIPAMVAIDTIVRLIPGVLTKSEATVNESFNGGQLEHPQYTRPEDYEGMKVPQVLLSGDHKEVKKWKDENSKKPTQ